MDLGENSEKVEECILLSFKLREEMELDDVDNKLWFESRERGRYK